MNKFILLDPTPKDIDPAVQKEVAYMLKRKMQDMEAKIATDAVIKALDNKEGLFFINADGKYEEMSYEDLVEDQKNGFPIIAERLLQWWKSDEN